MGTSMSTPPYTVHRVDRGAGSLYVRDYSVEGPAFVLMHGFPDNMHIYDLLVPYLVAAGRRVVLFDFLGFGQSDKPEGAQYTFKQQLGDLTAVVDQLDVDKVVPFGHDAAGPAAINFAIEQPTRVASLCILNTFFGASPAIRLPELIELFSTPSLRALAMGFAQSPAQLSWLLGFQQQIFRDALVPEQRAAFRATLQQINKNLKDPPSSGLAFMQMTSQLMTEVTGNTSRVNLMEALDVPVKLIWGENDPYIGREVAEDFQSHPKVDTLRLLTAGHWLQIDAPEAVALEMLS